MKCFLAYFAPLFFYIRNLFQLSVYDLVAVGSLMVTGTAAGVSYLLDLNYFGVSNLLIIFVGLTILANTVFGIKKSKMKAAEALAEARKLKSGPDYRMKMKLHKYYSFQLNRLQFVIFKGFTFLGYLKIAQTFLTEGNSFLDWTTAAIIQTPVAIFWYKEWKSFGDNSAYYFGKKAPIFEVTEFVFEMKLFSQFFPRKEEPPQTPEI